MSLRRASLIFCAALAYAVPALAEDRSCVGAFFAEGLTIGRIKAGQPRVFYRKNGDNKNSCPSAEEKCRDKAFLAPGDLVALGAKLGDFVCVDFDKGEGDRAGWLPASAIEPAPLATDPISWRGDWKRVEADISIEAAKDGLKATGEATFGALDPHKAGHGLVHTGEFSGPLTLKDGQATLTDENAVSGCMLRLARAGDFLFVRDNDQCGGLNVSFSGAYRKAAQKTGPRGPRQKNGKN